MWLWFTLFDFNDIVWICFIVVLITVAHVCLCLLFATVTGCFVYWLVCCFECLIVLFWVVVMLVSFVWLLLLYYLFSSLTVSLCFDFWLICLFVGFVGLCLVLYLFVLYFDWFWRVCICVWWGIDFDRDALGLWCVG